MGDEVQDLSKPSFTKFESSRDDVDFSGRGDNQRKKAGLSVLVHRSFYAVN